MAQHIQFKGIKRVLSSNTAYTQTDSFLYFVRESAQATSGDIWFMGHHYGHFGEHDLDAINTALEGFLTGQGEAGYKNVKEYIDEAVSAITSGMTTSVELGPDAFSGLTIEDKSTTPNVKDYVINLQNVAREDLLEKEIQDREDADEAIQTELDAVEAAVGLSSAGTHVQSSGRFTSAATTVEAEIAALDAALQNVADQTIVEGSSTEDYVKLDVATEDGVTTISINDSALTAAIEAMDLGEVHETGKAIVAVSEADGVVSATAGTVAAQYVDVADAAGKFTGKTVEAVLAEIDTAYKAADDELKELIDELSGSTDDLQAEVDRIETAAGFSADGNYVADDGQYVSAATSVLDATAKLNDALVQEVIDRNQAIEDAIEALIGDATESGNTLGELEDRIDELEADAKEYHIVKTTTGLPAEIKERYSLVDADGNVSGDTIDVPKDSHIVSITYITDPADEHYQNLEYVYLDVCGATKTEYVDMSELVLETEFASGVTVTDGVAHGVVDSTSETFLTVGAGGFKLSGVQNAIDAAVSAETEAREDADDAIESALTLTAQTLVEMIENAASAATTEVVEGTDAGNNLSIAETAGADGHKIYTINLTDVASASALTQEISDREDADATIQAELDAVESELGFDGTAYTQTVKNYISGNTVAEDIHLLDAALDANNDAIIALDERLDKIEDEYITAVTVNGVDATVADNAADVTIQADDIELGSAITADTGASVGEFAADEKVDNVLQAIVDALNDATAGSYTGVTSNDGSISLTPQTKGQDLSVNVKTLQLADVQAGETEVKKDESTGALYGVMYWIDEESGE